MLHKLTAALTFALLSLMPRAVAEPVHGIALYGAPKEPPGFTHFSYVNPNAPKGGRLVLGAFGSFDSLNPLIVKGVAVNGMRDFTIESLMARGLDEPFTLYGLIAETVEIPEDRSSITFNLNPQAHFSDGKPITADDVIFSFELLKEKGRPNHRTYFAKVAKTERLSDRSVRFTFDCCGRPRDPAHSWPSAGAAQTRHQARDVRLHDTRAAHRVGALSCRQGGRGALRHFRAR